RLNRSCTYARSREASLNLVITHSTASSKIMNLEARIKELEQALENVKLDANHSASTSNLSENLNFHSNGIFASPSSLYPINLSNHQPLSYFQLQKPDLLVSSLRSSLNPPFSLEIIVNMLEAFFENCNDWPVNFIHPRSFMAKTNVCNSALLYILCANGCIYSKYEPMLRLMGHNASEILFEAAKQNFDHEDSSFENLMTVIYMGKYSLIQGRLRQFWIYLNMASQYSKFQQIHLDPDDLELINGPRWSVIEKESRRRVWFFVNPLLQKFQLGTTIESTVKKPLPLKIFHALNDDIVNFSMSTLKVEYEAKVYDAEPLAQTLNEIGDDIRKFLSQYQNQEISFQTHFEANCLYQRLIHWFNSSPEWIQNILKCENAKNSFLAGSKSSFLALRLVLFYHSFILLVYRFTYSSLCRFPPPDIIPPGSESPQMKIPAFKVCWNSHHAIIDALKRHPILSQSSFVRVYTISALDSMPVFALFSCTMLKFADTQISRDIASRDFKFLKLCISADARFMPSIGRLILDLLDCIDSHTYGPKREDVTYQLFGIGVENFEHKILSLETFRKMNSTILNEIQSEKGSSTGSLSIEKFTESNSSSLPCMDILDNDSSYLFDTLIDTTANE
ncbi:hypothetical protein HK096_005753, partial [Nowakowskiella sp. JEL0078]